MARAELKEFREAVRVMRELGVVSWDGIVLGPEPHIVAKEKEEEKDPQARKRNYYSELLNRSVSNAELKNLP